MTETLFAFDERNYRDCQDGYRGARNQEYYLGDYTIENGSIIDVRAERKAVGSCSIIRMQARTRQSFMRSWTHIRDDATDVMVLWFVRRGQLHISNHEGTSIARAGEFALTKSMKPFSILCETDQASVHEALHVIVPAHEFRRFLPREVRSGFVVGDSGREFSIAEKIFREIFQAAGELPESTEQILLDSAIAVVAEAIRHREDCLQVRQTPREMRLQEVLRFIDLHLSDPNLSAAMVAEACGISSRYLSALLKENSTPFSDLVWDKRVKTASRWLATTRPADISIAEIAFRVGFKSPAHFSRMFKRVFGQGPREYRSNCLARRDEAAVKAVDLKSVCIPGGSTNTLQ